MSAAPAMMIPAALFFAIGAALIAWPRPAIALYIRLLRPMRQLFGRSLIDWEIGLLEGRAAPVFVRLFGAFAILSSLAMLFYAAAAPR